MTLILFQIYSYEAPKEALRKTKHASKIKILKLLDLQAKKPDLKTDSIFESSVSIRVFWNITTIYEKRYF